MKNISEIIDQFALSHPGLITLIIIAVAILAFIFMFIWNNRITTDGKYRYVIHGKQFYTFEDANYYYERQRDRKLKWVYLMVFDTEKEEYIFQGDFSHFTKSYVTQNDIENE